MAINKYKAQKQYGAHQDKTVMYDAQEQQYLDMKQLDSVSLMWMQVMRLGQMSLFDPDEGGKEMIIQVGSGAGAIIEKKYIPHSFSKYYYGIMHLFDLLINDIDKLDDPSKDRIHETWKLLQDVDEKSRDAYKYSSKLFRDLQRVINNYYGGGEGFVDTVDPRVAMRLLAEKKKRKEEAQK